MGWTLLVSLIVLFMERKSFSFYWFPTLINPDFKFDLVLFSKVNSILIAINLNPEPVTSDLGVDRALWDRPRDLVLGPLELAWGSMLKNEKTSQ